MHSLHGFNKSAPGCAQAQAHITLAGIILEDEIKYLSKGEIPTITQDLPSCKVKMYSSLKDKNTIQHATNTSDF